MPRLTGSTAPLIALTLAACAAPADDGPTGPTYDPATDPADEGGPGVGYTDPDGGFTGGDPSACSLAEAWSVDNGHGAIHAVALSSGGHVALAGEDGSVKIWDLGSREQGPDALDEDPGAAYGSEFGEGGRVQALSFLGDEVVVGGDDLGRVRAWDLGTGSVLAEAGASDLALTAVAVSDDGELAALADRDYGGGPRAWSLVSYTLGEEGMSDLWGVDGATFVEGTRVAVLGGHVYGQPALELRDFDTGEAVAHWGGESEMTQNMGSSSLGALAWSPDRDRLFAAGGGWGEGLLVVLDAADLTGEPLAWTRVPGHDVTALGRSPDGTLLFTTGTEGTLQVWDAATLAPVATADVPGPVGLAVDDVTGQVVVGGSDGRLRIFTCAG